MHLFCDISCKHISLFPAYDVPNFFLCSWWSSSAYMFSVFTTLPYCSYSFIISFFSVPYFTLIFLAVFISYLFFFYIFISQQSLRVFPFSHVLLLLFCSYDVHEHWHSYFYFPMSVFYFITYVVDCCNICAAHHWAVSCAMFTHLCNLYIVFVSPAKCCLAV